MSTEATVAPWQARLRAVGLRVTRQRLAVLEQLDRLGGHRPAEEIAGALAEAGTPLGRATLYKVLGDLVAAGLVTMADRGPGRGVYEIARSWHHHFVCRRCGTIRDVPCVVGAKPCLDPSEDVGDVDEAQIIFRGVCPACRAAEES